MPKEKAYVPREFWILITISMVLIVVAVVLQLTDQPTGVSSVPTMLAVGIMVGTVVMNGAVQRLHPKA